jgi:hypothetical protein
VYHTKGSILNKYDDFSLMILIIYVTQKNVIRFNIQVLLDKHDKIRQVMGQVQLMIQNLMVIFRYIHLQLQYVQNSQLLIM